MRGKPCYEHLEEDKMVVLPPCPRKSSSIIRETQGGGWGECVSHLLFLLLFFSNNYTFIYLGTLTGKVDIYFASKFNSARSFVACKIKSLSNSSGWNKAAVYYRSIKSYYYENSLEQRGWNLVKVGKLYRVQSEKT